MNYEIEKKAHCHKKVQEVPICNECNTCNKCNDKCSCKKKKNPCEKECVEDCPPIDMSNIRYRIKCDGASYSDLERIGISKGDNLDVVLSIISKFLLNLNFINTPNINGAKSMEDLFYQILERLEGVEQENIYLRNRIENINYQDQIDSIKYPKLIDTNSLGFTKNTELKNILQLIVNNGT